MSDSIKRPERLVFATNNPGKLSEVSEQLQGQIEILSLKSINCLEELPETGDTLYHNSHEKASYVKSNYQIDCFAEDTGLMIAALNGEPGIYSARYAGPKAIAQNNIDKVLKKMQGQSERQAYFATVITLLMGDEVFQFEGRVDGSIAKERLGDEGFGYDPIFIPDSEHRDGRSFAQMSSAEKIAISHRGRAVRKFLDFLRSLPV
jgi:XTP/dITP diphosphohydrolase